MLHGAAGTNLPLQHTTPADADPMLLRALPSETRPQAAPAGNRADVYALRDRAGVLAQLEAPPLVLHVAEAEHRKLTFEARRPFLPIFGCHLAAATAGPPLRLAAGCLP